MPIQIDRLETAVEIVAPERRAAPGQRSLSSAAASDPSAQPALREAVMKVLSEELDHFVRMRGL